MTRWIERDPRLSRLQHEMADTAVLLQGLGNRLTNHGKPDQGAHVRRLGLALAKVVVNVGGGSRFEDLLLHYPTVNPCATAEEKAEAERELNDAG